MRRGRASYFKYDGTIRYLNVSIMSFGRRKHRRVKRGGKPGSIYSFLKYRLGRDNVDEGYCKVFY